MSDDDFYDEYCPVCGDDQPCSCPSEPPECDRCGDTGQIVAADGYHEYLGYDYLPCPDCQFGATMTGDGPRKPW